MERWSVQQVLARILTLTPTPTLTLTLTLALTPTPTPTLTLRAAGARAHTHQHTRWPADGRGSSARPGAWPRGVPLSLAARPVPGRAFAPRC